MFCTACAQPLSPRAAHCPTCGSTTSAWTGQDRRSPSRRTAATGRDGWIVRALYVIPVIALIAVLALGIGRVQVRDRREADAYDAGLLALDAGALIDAETSFLAAGDYADAPDRLAETRALLRPLAAAYDAGAAALSAGKLDLAITQLLPVAVAVPDYRDVTLLLERARVAREAEALGDAARAADGGNWLLAERILSGLLADNPEDAALQARLLDLQRAHPIYIAGVGRQLVAASPGGGNPAVIVDDLPVSWPTWSPNRTRIAFVSAVDPASGAPRALYVVHPDGTGLRRLVEGPARWRAPVWSPDGRQIAFEVDGPTTENPSGRDTVLVVDVETGAVTDIVPPDLPNGGSPTWSPTGDRLAFVVRAGNVADATAGADAPLWTDGTVYVLDRGTGAFTAVAAPGLPHPWRISWSPTADEFLVFSRPEGSPYQEGTLDLLDLATGASSPIDASTIYVTMPVWAPDGHAFAYVASDVTLRVIGRDGSRAELPAPSLFTGFLAWAPTSDRLLALGPTSEEASLLVELNGPVVTASVLRIAYENAVGDPAPPQWSPFVPAATTAADAAGTALDAGA